MEVATASASNFALHTRMLATPQRTSPPTLNPNRALTRTSSSSSSLRASLSTNFLSASNTGSFSTEFSGIKLRPESLTFSTSRPKRRVVTMYLANLLILFTQRFSPLTYLVGQVIPYQMGSAWEQPPPDLASYLFKNRIVYLGMSLVPSVTELLLAEFLYLQYEDADKPIYLYINSTGTTKGSEKLGYETEAFAIYDSMRYVKTPIFTLCVGNAWGEAALLLAAGAKGNRSALPSSTIMIKQPIGRFQGQATDIDFARKEIKNVKAELVKLYAEHTGKTPEQIEADISRPKYFSPSEAVEYGIIDKVLYNERSPEDHGVVSDLKKAQLI
ncbi:hypothetical protein EZV62_023751 [Acer yangbiense]|uniref:ATP-dependent Clp protease proteolytic subunit n=1 Tax=Acer yangbiense TaxID=1000413 RepID=A0A5C7H2X2_9ROSI|nr:hypothetical protein EZV62_023751 [Acer yangbiense]